jgi:hypothetical protein
MCNINVFTLLAVKHKLSINLILRQGHDVFHNLAFDQQKKADVNNWSAYDRTENLKP